MILPPDYTRFHSMAGDLTRFAHDYYRGVPCRAAVNVATAPPPGTGRPHVDILPALGTHAPMTSPQVRSMFGPSVCDAAEAEDGGGGGRDGGGRRDTEIIVHDWRDDTVTIGKVPASLVSTATRGSVDRPWPAQLSRWIWDGGHDHVLSVGQVVPHEVTGMANYNKNLFVGAGGADSINLSHFIGAVAGMENLMGVADNPLRDILNYASEHFLHGRLPLWYVLTVMGNDEDGKIRMKGLFIGNDIECYRRACKLSLQHNFTVVDEPLKEVIVYLDPDEYHSTWLGNKSIYRTRMAVADGGNLIVIAPGVRKFGEDDACDALIRR